MPPTMRGASILSWKGLTSLIHRQLPLSGRDSQRLLSLLNSSFEEALDKKHPKVSPEGRNTTDQHVGSILASPMFGLQPTAKNGQIKDYPLARKVISRSPEDPALPHQGRIEPISLVHTMIEQNMRSFRKDIAAGRADLNRAVACLQRCEVLEKVLSRNHGMRATYALKTHNVGSTMLHWLWSSGLQDSDEIFRSRRFLQPLALFVALEGNLAQLMQWFQRLSMEAALFPLPPDLTQGRVSDPVAKVNRSQASLLECFQHCTVGSPGVKGMFDKYGTIFAYGSLSAGWLGADIRSNQRAIVFQMVLRNIVYDENKSLDGAIRCFLQALAAAEVSHDTFYERSFVFQPAGGLIISRIEKGRADIKVDCSLYDAFSRKVYLWSNLNKLMLAILQLHHPTKPACQRACEYLQWLTPYTIAQLRPIDQRRVVRMGINAAEKLLSDGTRSSARKAKVVMRIMQLKLGHELGILENSANTHLEGQKAGDLDIEETDLALVV